MLALACRSHRNSDLLIRAAIAWSRTEKDTRLIAASVIRQVEATLRRGVSQRRVAKELGVSRGTVGKVAAGTLTSIARQEYEDTISERRRPKAVVETFRCPRCGGKSRVFPCRRCFVETVASSVTTPDERIAVGLDLKPVHFIRYQEIRRWRREASRKRA